MYESIEEARMYNFYENEVMQEGVVDALKKFVDRLKEAIVKLIDKLDTLIGEAGDSKIKQTLKNILAKAKKLLTKTNNISTKEEAKECKDEFKEIEDEVNNLKNGNDKYTTKFKYFISSDTFDNAIKNKDLDALKVLLVGIIGGDPTWITTEYMEARKYIKDKSIEIFDEELDLEEEYEKQEDEDEERKKFVGKVWDERLYGLSLVWLRDNFATKERLPEIKSKGKIVYANKPTLGKQKYNSRKNKNI